MLMLLERHLRAMESYVWALCSRSFQGLFGHFRCVPAPFGHTYQLDVLGIWPPKALEEELPVAFLKAKRKAGGLLAQATPQRRRPGCHLRSGS